MALAAPVFFAFEWLSVHGTCAISYKNINGCHVYMKFLDLHVLSWFDVHLGVIVCMFFAF